MRVLRSLDLRMRATLRVFAPIFYKGDAFYCSVCHHTARKFKRAGTGKKARDAAVCPFCQARERDRLAMLFFEKHPELFPVRPADFLHVAPEMALQPFLRSKTGKGYLSADIYRADVMERIDITNIKKPDGYFGGIFCSHVLQDVADDNLAIRELYRILVPGGWAILNVPYYKGTKTTRLQPIVKGNDRPIEFLRDYGEDYIQQLESAGFKVAEYSPRDLWDFNDHQNPGLDHVITGFVHFCRKPVIARDA